MKFTKMLTDQEIDDLKEDDEVLVVNTKNEYEPFIGVLNSIITPIDGYKRLVIVDKNYPEDYVTRYDENLLIFKCK